MFDRFQGDPKLKLTADGSTIEYQGGQPVMDQGFENLAMISLFTEPGWWGNDLIDIDDEIIGSNFLESTRKPITLQSLTDIKQQAENALDNQAFGKVTATVQNTEYDRIIVTNRIEPPGNDSQEIVIKRNGQNWINQAENPAYERIT